MSSPSSQQMVARSYCDPKADIILVVECDIRCYVDSFYLRASSTFFRDMLSNNSLGTNTPKGTATTDVPGYITIDFPHPLPDVILFLDFMHKLDVPKADDFAQYERILKLCDQYGCDLIVECIITRLYAVIAEAPWSIFCIASHLDDVVLAKSALKVMGSDAAVDNLKVSTITHELAAKCSLPYLLGFAKLGSQQNVDQYTDPRFGRSYGDHPYNWKTVAEAFQPVRK